MIRKTTPQIEVLYASLQATIHEVASLAQKHCPAMLSELEGLGIQPSGPWIFVAYGMPEDPNTTFNLELCIPAVKPQNYTGPYHFKELEAFECESIEVRGPLNHLFEYGYAPLLHTLRTNGELLSGQSREIYREWHGPESDKNRIELQIGVQTVVPQSRA